MITVGTGNLPWFNHILNTVFSLENHSLISREGKQTAAIERIVHTLTMFSLANTSIFNEQLCRRLYISKGQNMDHSVELTVKQILTENKKDFSNIKSFWTVAWVGLLRQRAAHQLTRLKKTLWQNTLCVVKRLLALGMCVGGLWWIVVVLLDWMTSNFSCSSKNFPFDSRHKNSN